MRALSLWQPWATAMRVGVKTIETRSWKPPSTVALPFLLAVHASKHADAVYGACGLDLTPAIATARLAGAVVGVDTTGILGIVRVVGVAPTYDEGAQLRMTLSAREQRWGDYCSGRFAWFTESVEWFKEPIPCRGHQGLFHVVGDAAAALRARGYDAPDRPSTPSMFPEVRR